MFHYTRIYRQQKFGLRQQKFGLTRGDGFMLCSVCYDVVAALSYTCDRCNLVVHTRCMNYQMEGNACLRCADIDG